MKLNQIIKANHDDFESIRKAMGSATDYVINIGERLADAKSQVDDFKEWVRDTQDFNYMQCTRYIRVAKHKAQARALIHQHGEISVDKLQKLLPATSADPIIVEQDTDQLAYVGSKPGTVDKDDWHTPEEYIQYAAKVMGSIDLDPFTSVHSNHTVNAKHILTQADDAFTTDWSHPDIYTCWMNPPYSKGASGHAVDKFLEEYDKGTFEQAIVLMNNATDTVWFNRMSSAANVVAFTRGRIAFENSDGKATSGNTRGQVFFYLGNNSTRFREVFGEFCNCYLTGTI